MSSTNRGGQRSEADFYATPAWCVDRLIEDGELSMDRCWLEPCAGDGAIIRAVNMWTFEDIEWTACELREECRTHLAPLVIADGLHIGDFLSSPIVRRAHLAPNTTAPEANPFDVCITNPPFSLAEPIIAACLPLARRTVMLLRLNYLGSEERAAQHRRHAPDVAILPNRPSFCLNDKGRPATDSIEYAWFTWHGLQERASGVLRVLNSTPKDVRKAHGQRLIDAKRRQNHKDAEELFENEDDRSKENRLLARD